MVTDICLFVKNTEYNMLSKRSLSVEVGDVQEEHILTELGIN